MCFCGEINQSTDSTKALTALVGQLFMNVGWENSPERELKTVSFNP